MKNKNLLALVVAGTLLFGVSSATSDYMHYQTVNGIGTISICDPASNGERCITMKNKNEGATQPGVGCINYANNCWEREYFGDTFENEEDCNSRGQGLYEACMETHSGEYGKHYQWGNNHGFLPCLDSNGCETFPGNEDMTTNERVDTTDYGPQNYFDRAVFSKITNRPYDWSKTRNDNLRGGANDSQSNNRGYDETNNVATNVTGRQGPCGEGYHVPSIGEWNKVLEYWAEENGIYLYGEYGEGLLYNDDGDQNFMQFQEDFKIPFAGYRSLDAKVYGIGVDASLWSSTPIAGTDYARYFELYYSTARAYNNFRRAYGFSVRCFKDSYLSFPTNESGDGGSGSASTHVTLTLTAGSNTCTLNDYNLGTHDASAEEQYLESSGQEILCEFLQNTGVRVLLSMDNLSDGSKLIGAENFTGVVTAIGNSLGSISNLTGGNYNLSGSQEIYRKAVNTLGKWTGDLQIIGTIPAGTPSGTYTGSLEIVIQEG